MTAAPCWRSIAPVEPPAQPPPHGPRRPLPAGTVTFLFTDIEGSTELITRLGSAYEPLLEAHRAILRAAFEAEGGVEVQTEGDAFFVAFASASAAAAACVAAQRALAAHPWPQGSQIRVRMGLHTGEATPTPGGDYTSLEVHRAARIAAAGHGGQILVSETTRALIGATLPPDVTIFDLGFATGDPWRDALLADLIPSLAALLDDLTPRQAQIAGRVLADGARQAEVAAALGVSRATVSVAVARGRLPAIASARRAMASLLAGPPAGVSDDGGVVTAVARPR